MAINRRIQSVARRVLTDCLSLPAGADIVLITDELTKDIATELAEAAIELEVQPVVVYCTIAKQKQRGANDLQPWLVDLFESAAAVLNCLNSSPECFNYRDEVRKAALSANCKVAHMPGIDAETLLLADVDYNKMVPTCEMLAAALIKGRRMEIITRDKYGNDHHLFVDLNPWNRLPIISDAVIQKGSWGNVPSGETYIAPPEGLAKGTVVINGSIPNYVMKEDEEMILTFKEGRLVDPNPSDSEPVRHFVLTQVDVAKSKGDPNWDVLAEIGFGVNPRVESLTGNSLFDEKKYGTIHIAIGDSLDMGGTTKSVIHCDMICERPEVKIDGKTIIADGKIVLKKADWYEDYRHLNPLSEWDENLKITATAKESHVDAQGRLRRAWDAGSARVCSITVGNNETAQMAANVFRDLLRLGSLATVVELAAEKRELTVDQLLQIVLLLRSYGLVEVRN